jgi:hypothetical protein
MGWWRNDAGDQLGDEPADIVQRGLEQLVASRGVRPALAQLLRHLEEVLRHKTNDLCVPGEDRRFRGLVADVEEASGDVITVRPAGPIDPEMRAELDSWCESVSDAYAVLGRRPSRRELLRTFDFVLGYAPDRFLEIAASGSVREIRVE